MIIKNGRVFNDNFRFEKRDVYIEDGKIVASIDEVTDKTVIDATGKTVIPGAIDVHTHGAVGYSFCGSGEEGLKAIAAYEKKCGVTGFCPTSMTLSKEMLKAYYEVAYKLKDSTEGARILGINMEGPFVSVAKKGAQNEAYIHKADYEFFKELNDACDGMIKLVNVAPEEDGALEFIKKASGEVGISLGHTAADYETTYQAIQNGARHITHIFCAMTPFTHREPGVIGAARDCAECRAELICDGVHVHPSAVRAAFEMFGDDRIVLISDSLECAGMPDGEYMSGGLKVILNGRKAALEDGTIAGSATNLFECMKRAMEFGIPAESAIKAATANPAKAIGVYDKVGSITPGKLADIVIVNSDFEIERVI